MHILDVLTRIHLLDVLMLLLATTMIAPLFCEFQPLSNNAAGSVAVPKTTVLSSTTVLKHNYAVQCTFMFVLIPLLVQGTLHPLPSPPDHRHRAAGPRPRAPGPWNSALPPPPPMYKYIISRAGMAFTRSDSARAKNGFELVDIYVMTCYDFILCCTF